MPDDPILNSELTQQDTPAQEPTTVAAQPATPAPDNSVSREEFTQAFSSLNDAVQRMTNTFAQSQRGPGPKDPTEEEFAQRFYEKPMNTLHEEVSRAAAPLVAQVAEFSADYLIEKQKDQIDTKYGPGTYDAVFAKSLDPVFADARQNQPALLLNKKAVENAFKTVAGDNIDALVERRAAFTKSQQDAGVKQRDEMRTSIVGELGNLTGGNRLNNKPTLTEEHRNILKDMVKATGESIDGNRLLGLAGANTYEAWKERSKSLNGSGKGAQ